MLIIIQNQILFQCLLTKNNDKKYKTTLEAKEIKKDNQTSSNCHLLKCVK